MELVNKGKKTLTVIIICCLFMSLAVTALSSVALSLDGNTNQAKYELMQGLFRFVLECLLFLLIYKGHRWARLIAIVLFMLGGIVSLFTAFIVSYFMLIIAVPYIIFSILLLGEPIKVFQKYKKHGDIDGQDTEM